MPLIRTCHSLPQVELSEYALFGYGHPGLTRTSLTESVANDYDKELMIAKMVGGRFEKDDYQVKSSH